ncbi:hypothetical protein GPECTOR_75g747 [Gonium pectorale]|uniref:Uncharacterized protein n=1 Tax=Gonium pectorale TaxID=33097 RepID=A0A150G2H5_GONPE|nr:hypothetical protein GPECTOR_75g747 [Gonium pectorale]|eukprot:KXZ44023.1 hypothetical protein GPECTOR_75g747 [Gonium pectorale]
MASGPADAAALQHRHLGLPSAAVVIVRDPAARPAAAQPLAEVSDLGSWLRDKLRPPAPNVDVGFNGAPAKTMKQAVVIVRDPAARPAAAQPLAEVSDLGSWLRDKLRPPAPNVDVGFNGAPAKTMKQGARGFGLPHAKTSATSDTFELMANNGRS